MATKRTCNGDLTARLSKISRNARAFLENEGVEQDRASEAASEALYFVKNARIQMRNGICVSAMRSARYASQKMKAAWQIYHRLQFTPSGEER
jgi:hypothetical protein